MSASLTKPSFVGDKLHIILKVPNHVNVGGTAVPGVTQVVGVLEKIEYAAKSLIVNVESITIGKMSYQWEQKLLIPANDIANLDILVRHDQAAVGNTRGRQGSFASGHAAISSPPTALPRLSTNRISSRSESEHPPFSANGSGESDPWNSQTSQSLSPHAPLEEPEQAARQHGDQHHYHEDDDGGNDAVASDESICQLSREVQSTLSPTTWVNREDENCLAREVKNTSAPTKGQKGKLPTNPPRGSHLGGVSNGGKAKHLGKRTKKDQDRRRSSTGVNAEDVGAMPHGQRTSHRKQSKAPRSSQHNQSQIGLKQQGNSAEATSRNGCDEELTRRRERKCSDVSCPTSNAHSRPPSRQSTVGACGEQPKMTSKQRHLLHSNGNGTTRTHQPKAPLEAHKGYKTGELSGQLNVPSASPVQKMHANMTASALGIEPAVLMEVAGREVASAVLRSLGGFKRMASRPSYRIVVMVGRHWQGAVGLLATRHLCNRGLKVVVIDRDSACVMPADFKRAMKSVGDDLKGWTMAQSVEELPHDVGFVLDAIGGFVNPVMKRNKGSEADRAAKERSMVEWANSQVWGKDGQGRMVGSVEVPTGVNPETGLLSESRIRPKWTVALGIPVDGLSLHTKDITGDVFLCDLGLPSNIWGQVGVKAFPQSGAIWEDKYVVPLFM